MLFDTDFDQGGRVFLAVNFGPEIVTRPFARHIGVAQSRHHGPEVLDLLHILSGQERKQRLGLSRVVVDVAVDDLWNGLGLDGYVDLDPLYRAAIRGYGHRKISSPEICSKRTAGACALADNRVENIGLLRREFKRYEGSEHPSIPKTNHRERTAWGGACPLAGDLGRAVGVARSGNGAQTLKSG